MDRRAFFNSFCQHAVSILPQEYAESSLEVVPIGALESGPALATHADFITLGGKPFFPVGTNYFTTEENGWDFSGPRNAVVFFYGATFEAVGALALLLLVLNNPVNIMFDSPPNLKHNLSRSPAQAHLLHQYLQNRTFKLPSPASQR